MAIERGGTEHNVISVFENDRRRLDLSIFTEKTRPYYDKYGRLLVPHAPEIPYDIAAEMWEEKYLEMKLKLINRGNFQVVILNPRKGDITMPLQFSLENDPIGNARIAYTKKNFIWRSRKRCPNSK